MVKRNSAVPMDMEKYEQLFNEFFDKITPITGRVASYFIDPLENPHYVSHELLQEMELLHIKLSTALYLLRNGNYKKN